MKPLKSLLTFSVLFSALSVNALELGAVAVGGTGCYGTSELTLVDAEAGIYEAPVRIKIYKNKKSAFERKSCNFRLPFTLASNEKLQIVDLSRTISLSVAKDAEISSQLTVSLVGQKNEPLTDELKSEDLPTSIRQKIKVDGVVAESECGKSNIVTGNLNLLAKGSGKAYGHVHSVQLGIRNIHCE